MLDLHQLLSEFSTAPHGTRLINYKVLKWETKNPQLCLVWFTTMLVPATGNLLWSKACWRRTQTKLLLSTFAGNVSDAIRIEFLPLGEKGNKKGGPVSLTALGKYLFTLLLFRITWDLQRVTGWSLEFNQTNLVYRQINRFIDKSAGSLGYRCAKCIKTNKLVESSYTETCRKSPTIFILNALVQCGTNSFISDKVIIEAYLDAKQETQLMTSLSVFISLCDT